MFCCLKHSLENCERCCIIIYSRNASSRRRSSSLLWYRLRCRHQIGFTTTIEYGQEEIVRQSYIYYIYVLYKTGNCFPRSLRSGLRAHALCSTFVTYYIPTHRQMLCMRKVLLGACGCLAGVDFALSWRVYNTQSLKEVDVNVCVCMRYSTPPQNLYAACTFVSKYWRPYVIFHLVVFVVLSFAHI